MSTPLHVLILAAGQGKRMQSNTPKVLHRILFRPMIHYVLDLARAISPQSITTVVGFGSESVKSACSSYSELRFVDQVSQRGTGHAVLQAESVFEGKRGTVLILSADVILLTPETVNRLIQQHRSSSASCTVLTAVLSSPTGYGRVLRESPEKILAIREDKDCSLEEKRITDVNSGIYCFEISALFSSLESLTDRNQSHEYYLTDTIEILLNEQKKVTTISTDDPMEIMGINDRQALWRVESILQRRSNQKFFERGVTIRDVHTTYIDLRCNIEPDVDIEGGCTLVNSEVHAGTRIESGVRLIDSKVGRGCTIKQGSYIEGSEIDDACSIGPYARLRPGTQLKKEVKIGNFVEIKRSAIGSRSKASHLSYIGDAEIGQDVNLGCGFITCNFDGTSKHRTIVEDGVFVGSDSQMVAPVKIGAGSYIASGTTVTDDVPNDSLVLSRVPQVTKSGYSKKYHGKEKP